MGGKLNSTLLVIVLLLVSSLVLKVYFPDGLRLPWKRSGKPAMGFTISSNAGQTGDPLQQFGQNAGGMLGQAFSSALSQAFDPSKSTSPSDIDAIKKLSLAADASQADVRDYLDRLQELSGPSGMKSSTDPQVDAICRLGPGRLPIIFEYLDGKLGYYIEWALEKLVAESNKDLILAKLQTHKSLIDFVLKYAWEKDAQETIKKEIPYLEVGDSDDDKWFDAAIACNDKSMLPLLFERFFHKDKFFEEKRDGLYTRLVAIPGFPIDEFHRQWWLREGVTHIETKEKAKIAGLVARNGVVPALLDIANSWKRPVAARPENNAKDDPKQVHDQLGQILDSMAPNGSTTDARADWAITNVDNLRLDWQAGVYMLPPARPS